MREIWVQSLGWEDALEKGMATHSSILAWKIPRTEEPGRLQSMESQRVGHNWSDLAYSIAYVVQRCAFLVAQMVKHLPAVQETQLQSLGWEDALEKEMATHSSTLAWKIPWTEEPGRLQSMGSQKSLTWLSDFTFTLWYKIHSNNSCWVALQPFRSRYTKQSDAFPEFTQQNLWGVRNNRPFLSQFAK